MLTVSIFIRIDFKAHIDKTNTKYYFELVPIEEHFEINIPDEDKLKLRTVDDVVS
jgi:hypothetical protein